MSKQVLLPAPNWFLNSLADCSIDGTLAYGSRNGIVFVRSIEFPEGGAPFPGFSLIPNAHKDRVTAVSWSNRTLNEDMPKYLLATSSDDCSVAIWDTDTLDLIQRHHEHNNIIIGLDWTKVGDLQLVSVDEKGFIVVWDLVRNNVRVQKMMTTSSRLLPIVLKCSPIDSDIIGVGCKDGLVCIISIKGLGNILHRLRGHDKSVVSLSWCPVTAKLASSSMDQKILVWHKGQVEKSMQIPQKSLSGVVKVKPGEKSQAIMKQPVVFLKPDQIISGSMNSEVLSWNPTEENPSPTLLHSEHTRGLYCMTHNDKVVWTMAQDRMLIRHDLESNLTSVFSTLGGFVYCIATCPFAPGRVAIGVGDESIRIWSMSDTTGSSTATIWQKIKGKVLTLAWHPEKEGELAFGTSDGRVGICNASNPSKDVVVMHQYHKSSVYRVSWGPAVYKKDATPPEQKMYLYACDEHNAVVYMDSSAPPVPLKAILRAANPHIREDLKHKDIAWKPDKSLLALGLEDGSIQLLTAPHLQAIHTLLSHKKTIFFLAWHPSNTAVEANEQNRQNWLASTSMDQQIHVYDLTPLWSDGDKKEWKGAPLPLEPISSLKHGGKVVCLAWSPHVGGQLVSSSYDMSVKVWDAVKGDVLACYTEHNGCVMTCCWSALNPDIIMSGSADFTCRTWRISETSAENKPALRSKLREEKKGSMLVPVPTNAQRMEMPNNKPSSNDEGRQHKPQEKFSAQQKVGNKISMFPISNASFLRNSVECCLYLLDAKGLDPPGKKAKLAENGQGDISEANHFGFFSTQDEAVDLLKKEADALKKTNNYGGLQNLKIWQGDIQQTIKDCISSKKLDDWLVSMAPSVSHKFWLETCTAYAEQLVEEENVLKAASYYVSCHKVPEAIAALQKHKLFKEAVALCHLRLPADDPLLHSTLRSWGKYSQDTGNYEISVQCYIAVGDYEKAAVVLYKRKDPKLWQLGTFLAKLADANDLFLSMSVGCFYHFLMNQDWEAASELISGLPELQHFESILKIHKKVCEKEKQGLSMEKIWTPTESVITELEELVGDVTNDQFQHFIQSFAVNTQLPENRKELLLATSKLLLLAVAGKKCAAEDWEQYIILALHLNYRRSLVVVKERPLHLLLQWLGNLELAKFDKSFQSFKAAAHLASAKEDDAELLSFIEQNRSVLLDPECARFARLEVQIPDLEKKLAAAHVKHIDLTKLQEDLITLKIEKEGLEKTRVAFLNPLIVFCRLQGLVDSLHSKMKPGQLDSLEAEMDAFRALMQG